MRPDRLRSRRWRAGRAIAGCRQVWREAQRPVHGVPEADAVADVDEDNADELTDVIRKNGLDSVFMVTPNTTLDRQKKIAKLCTGFIYTVSLLGVTGARSELSDQVKPLIASLKAQTDVPICVGFGVSRPEHVRQLADAGADGVIVGSALVNLIEENLNTADHGKKKLTEYLQKMKGAL